jgi:predicted anti-sigma-YlaC factor YlaD
MNSKITCKKAVDLISKKEEGKLSTFQRFRLWRHLAECSLCRRFSAQNKLIAKAFTLQQGGEARLTQQQKEEIVDSVIRSGPEQ